jgi:hypothetical protein
LNFGKVTFSHFHAHAVGNEQGDEQGDEQNDEQGNNHDGDNENHDGDNTVAITMKDAAGNVRAVPSHGEDNRFSVTWKHS